MSDVESCSKTWKTVKKGLCHIWLGGELYLQATHLWAIDHWATLVGVRLGWVELSKFWKPQQSFGRRPFESSTSQQPNSVGLKERTWVKSFFFILTTSDNALRLSLCWKSSCDQRGLGTKLHIWGDGIWSDTVTGPPFVIREGYTLWKLLLCSSYENFKQLFFCELSL